MDVNSFKCEIKYLLNEMNVKAKQLQCEVLMCVFVPHAKGNVLGFGSVPVAQPHCCYYEILHRIFNKTTQLVPTVSATTTARNCS